MPERASVSQAVQIGVEVTPGTPVAANKLLNSLGLEPGVQVDMQSFRPTGQKFDSIITPGKEWIEAGISGVASYSELAYLLSGILVASAGVQNGATTAYDWTFKPAARSADTVKTFTVEQGDSVRAHSFAYGLINELTLGFSRDGVELGGSMIGQRLSDGVALTAAPTAIEEKPILPTHIDVFLDATSAGIGVTKLTRVLTADLTIGDRFNPVWTLNSALGSFASHVEAVPDVSLELLVEADAAGMALLNTLRAGGTHYIEVRATHTDLAGTALPYWFKFQMAAKISDVSDFSDEDGLYAITWTNKPIYDASWDSGTAIKALLRNKLITL
jgi:hypothetical protein